MCLSVERTEVLQASRPKARLGLVPSSGLGALEFSYVSCYLLLSAVSLCQVAQTWSFSLTLCLSDFRLPVYVIVTACLINK